MTELMIEVTLKGLLALSALGLGVAVVLGVAIVVVGGGPREASVAEFVPVQKVAQTCESVPVVAAKQTSNGFSNHFFQASHSASRYEKNGLVCTETEGMSMAPTIFPGNTVCYAPYQDELGAAEGDMIVFWGEDHTYTVTHVVIAVYHAEDGSRQFMTMGYNNAYEDSGRVNESDVVGVVVEVRYS